MDSAWEELSLGLAVRGATGEQRTSDLRRPSAKRRSALADLLQALEQHPDRDLNLSGMAREAALSRYHFPSGL